MNDNVKYLSLLRQSTTIQELSGIGIQSQRNGIADYIQQHGGTLVKEIVETSSGKKYLPDRPKLQEALNLCKGQGWKLIVWRLDRLSREVYLISQLLKSGVQFVFCDLPQADTFSIHILAACAQREREIISRRNRESAKVVKARLEAEGSGLGAKRTHLIGISKLNKDKKLKPPRKWSKEEVAKGQKKTAELQTRNALERWEHLRGTILEMKRKKLTLQQIADELNSQNLTTPKGHCKFHRASIFRALSYYKKSEKKAS